jgi:hypothetical protein
MRSTLAKIAVLVFVPSLLVSCVAVVHTGPPRSRAYHAVWVADHWGPHNHWVPGHWVTR